MFTQGRILFIVFFVVAFVVALVWAYRKDKALHKVHFSKPYLVLIGLLAFIGILYLIVKIRHLM